MMNEIYSNFFFQTIPAELDLKHTRYLPILTRHTQSKTLVLDLDETLIHSSLTPIPSPDQVITLSSTDQDRKLYVKYRPGLMDFLNKMSKIFELVLFTASTKEYSEKVLKIIDPQSRLIKYRFFRDSCMLVSGHYIKDLSRLGRDLKDVIILDNSVYSFACHLNNGIPIMSWFDDPNDIELYKASSLLEKIRETEDVRTILESLFNLKNLLKTYIEKLSQ